MISFVRKIVRHFGFWPFKNFRDTFESVTQAYFFSLPFIDDESIEKRTYALHGQGIVWDDPTSKNTSDCYRENSPKLMTAAQHFRRSSMFINWDHILNVECESWV